MRVKIQLNLDKVLKGKVKFRYDEQNSMWFDKILTIAQRGLSYIIVEIIKVSKITPNQITIFRIIFFPIIFFFFSRGSYLDNVLGLVTILIYTLLDTVDGDLARAKDMTSDLGAWLDHSFDKVMVNVVLVGVAIGAYNVTNNPLFLIGGLIALFFQAMVVNVSNDYTQLYGEDVYFDSPLKKKLEKSKKSKLLDRILVHVFVFNSFWSYFFFTIRYQMIVGVLFGVLRYMVFYWAVVLGFRWMFYSVFYALMLKKGKSRFVLINLLRNKYEKEIKK